MAIPLICGVTTTPNRIRCLRDTIDSLVSQSRLPDQIFLSLPMVCDREPNVEYIIPDWVTKYEPILRIVRPDRDYGPGTKLLGCLRYITEPSCLVILDDDMKYKPTMLDRLYTAQLVDRRASFSFYTYSWGPLKAIGQGSDGFSFYSPNLVGVETFARRILNYSPLRLHDDIWISAFLQQAGIQIRNLRSIFAESGHSFEKSHEIDQLRHLKGNHSRDAVTQCSIRWLINNGHFGHFAKWNYRVRKSIKRLLLLD